MTAPTTDEPLADEVRAMLRRRAADIGDDLQPGERAYVPPAAPPPRPRRHVLAWAAVVLAAVLIGGLAVVAIGDRADEEAATFDQPARGSGSLPAGFDAATARPVFTADGGPDDVADAYLADRFPDFPAPGVRIVDLQVADGDAVARWSASDLPYGGEIRLRRDGGRWGVVVATTGGIDLSNVRHDGSRIVGAIRAEPGDLVAADILDLDGAPVPDAPRPAGHPGGGRYRWGTAGDSDSGSLDLDVPVDGGAVLRVQRVGGTMLTIAEAYLEPPAGADRLWPWAGDDGADRSTPAAAARSFATAVVGDAVASVAVASDGPNSFDVALVGGAVVHVLAAPDPRGDGYVVVQAGDGGPGLVPDPAPSTATLLSRPTGAVTAELVVVTSSGAARRAVTPDELAAERVTLDVRPSAVIAMVVVWRDAGGVVVGFDGGHF